MTIISELIWSNMDLIVLVILPVIILFIILWICKKYNFSVMPDGFDKSRVGDFEMPELSRKKTTNGYKWEAKKI